MTFQKVGDLVNLITKIVKDVVKKLNMDKIIPATVQSIATVSGKEIITVLKPQDNTTIDVWNCNGLTLLVNDEVYIQKIGGKLGNSFILSAKRQQTTSSGTGTNIVGGRADSIYGGTTPIEGGNAGSF